MSEVKVNKISPRSGTAVTLGDSGDTFTIPSGATLAIAGTVTGFTSAGIDDNATSVAITIDSSERVGIGSTSPSTKLTINEGGEPPAEGMLLLQANSSSRQLRIQPPTNSDNGFIDFRGGNLTFLDDGTEVARFQSGGKFGIGTSAPTGALDVKSGTQPQLKVTTASPTASYNSGFLVTASNSATAGSRSVVLSLDADGGDGSGTDNLTITKTGNGGNATITNQNNASLVFGTNNAEAARFTTNTFMVGKTSASGATNGVELKTNDESRFTQTGRTVIAINRLSSDGSIVGFKKDNTTVGNIGIESAGFYIDGEALHTGLIFTSNSVSPRDNGSATNNATDLGNSVGTWKDLYLGGNAVIGGGIKLGGTGTANTLDDYEEGTFTPAYDGGVNGTSYQFQVGEYTKIGNQCYIQIQIKGNGNSANSSQVRISGLPFASDNSSPYGGAVANYNAGFKDDGDITFHKGSNDTLLYFYENDGSSFIGTEADDINQSLLLHGFYRTA